MRMISEQVKELRELADCYYGEIRNHVSTITEAADTIECLIKWNPCSEPPKHSNEVLIFNGKSYSVGYYDGKTWVNAIHPVEWQEIRRE